MNIAIITDSWEPLINGVTRTLFTTVDHLRDRGHTVLVIEPMQGSLFSLSKYPEIKMIWNPWETKKAFDNFNPDCVHIATEGPLGFYYRNLMKIRKKKFTTSYHTKFPEFLENIANIPANTTYKYMRWFHKPAKNILVTTKSMIEELENNGFQNNMIEWNRGVYFDVFKPRFEQKNENLVFLNVGRISKEKNLEAFFELNLPGEKRMVGDGPMREEYEKKYPDVVFTGYKVNDDLSKEYANADVFVFPSKADAFGNVMLEAMSCGTPVAGYDTTGPRDLIVEGINGFYQSNDLLENCLKCLDLNRNSVYSSVQKYSWKHSIDVFESSLVNTHE